MTILKHYILVIKMGMCKGGLEAKRSHRVCEFTPSYPGNARSSVRLRFKSGKLTRVQNSKQYGHRARCVFHVLLA